MTKIVRISSLIFHRAFHNTAVMMGSVQNETPPTNATTTKSKQKSINELREWLQPTDYLSPGNEHMKHLHSYVPGTGDWLRDSPPFRRWEDGTDRGCLWVRGTPGTGKSVFAASTVKTLTETQDREGKSAPTLFFFFRQIVEKNHDPKYLIRDWAAQLLPSSKMLREKIDYLTGQCYVDGNEHTRLWDALVESLDGMRKVYCVADALDEMDDQHADFIEKLRDLGLRRPESIKVLLTSRPIPRIEKQLRHLEVEAVRLDPKQIYPDTVWYIASRLASLEPRLSFETEIKVTEAICVKAEGHFLYARLIMDSLTEGLREGSILEETLPTSLEELPTNLKELYTRMLAENSRRSGITQEQQFTILQCVVHASRPLRLIELGCIVALLKKDSGIDLKKAKDLVRQACGRLLEILEDESVSVIHHSFTEFARDQSRIGDAGAFPVLNESESQKMMLQVCLQYLESCDLSIIEEDGSKEVEENEHHETLAEQYEHWGYDDLDYYGTRCEVDDKKEQQLKDLRNAYPLMQYATKNLTYHIEKTEAAGLEYFSLLDSYFAPGCKAYDVWVLSEWNQYRLENLQALHIAAFLGLTKYAQHLIRIGSPVDARDGHGRAPLIYAAKEGHLDVVSSLLSNGADPMGDDRDGYRPLHVAAKRNHVEIAKLFLEAGVSPKITRSRVSPEYVMENFASNEDETPLEFACRRGHIGILRLFMDSINKEDACRCLQWCVNSRSPEVVEAILKTGKAPVDVFFGGVTALARASHDMSPDIIKILLEHGADPNLRMEKEDWYYDDVGEEILKIEINLESANGYTPILEFASRPGDCYGSIQEGRECLKFLVDAGADMNARAKSSHTALHLAAENAGMFTDYLDSGGKTGVTVVELLLEQGADPTARCNKGATPLHKVSSSEPGLVDVLLKYGADINARDAEGCTPLISFLKSSQMYRDNCCNGYRADVPEQVILKLLEHGADVQAEDNTGWTVAHHLFASMEKFKSETLWAAFIKAGVDLNKPNTYGKPPLLCKKELYGQHAMESEKIMAILVKEGLDLGATASTNEMLLFRLLENDAELAAVQRALNHGGSVKVRDNNGRTILHQCIRQDTPMEIFLYLVKQGAELNVVDHDGNSIMHDVALQRTSQYGAPMIEKIINLGVNTDAPNKTNRSLLHMICANSTGYHNEYKVEDMLDVFLDGKVCPVSNINALDDLGASPMHYAAVFSEKLVGYLLRKGAESALKTLEGLTPLHVAARGRASNAINVLLSDYKKRGILEGMINAVDQNGYTALHYAAKSGRPESVYSLLSAGADVFAQDKVGRTPLHALAEVPEEELLWIHIQRETKEREFNTACVSLGDVRRPTIPLYQTTDSDKALVRDILELLVNAGADIHAKCVINGEEQTVMDLAVRTKCKELVNACRRRGMIAGDSLAEALIPHSGGKDEAKTLLERIDSRRPGEWGREVGQPGSQQDRAKFEEILVRRDYDLFSHFVEIGGNLLALGEGHYSSTALHLLVARGHTGLLEKHCEEASKLDSQPWMTKETSPGTLLMHACEQALPRLDVIKFLVEKAQVDVNKPSKEYQNTALHQAAAGAHFWNIEAVEYLLNHGSNIEATNANGETPLMAAIGSERGDYGFWNEEIIRVLLKAGANPNAVGNDGKSCLTRSNHASITSLLLENGAEILAGKIPSLTSAIEKMDVDMARWLLATGADSNENLALYEAARPCPPDRYETSQRIQSQRGMIKLLLQYGSDPFKQNADRTSVVQKVIEEHGILDLFWELPNFPVDLKGQGGRTLLISTCYPIVEVGLQLYKYLEPKKHSVYIPDTALALIAKGADVTAKDDLGRTALHWLCTLSLPDELDESYKKLVMVLIDRSPALIHERDNQGFKPFHLAAVNAHWNTWMTDFLITKGYDPKESDPDGNNVLHHLAKHLVGEKGKARMAIERFKYFLSLGAPLEQKNELGETPLFRFICTSWEGSTGPAGSSNPDYAIKNDISHVQAIPLFLEAEADLQTRNVEGEGLLHATAMRWRVMDEKADQEHDIVEIFEELLSRGLDPRIEDVKYRTPIDIAVAMSARQIVDLFGVKEMEVVKEIEVLDTEDEEEGSERGEEVKVVVGKP